MSQTTHELLLLGIDPGWTNLGAAVTSAVMKEGRWSGKVEVLQVYKENPSRWSSPEGFCRTFLDEIHEKYLPGNLTIERYASYGTVRSTHTEEITELIGMLKATSFINFEEVEVGTVRAIDWKMSLVKYLNREFGFQNESRNGALDKGFSLQAARFLSTNPDIITNDHVADAICLSTWPLLQRYEAERLSGKSS